MKIALLSVILLLISTLHGNSSVAAERKGDKAVWKQHYNAAIASWNSGEVEATVEAFKLSIEEAKLYAKKEYHLAFSLGDLGMIYMALDEHPEGVKYLEEALSAAAAVKGRHAPEMVIFLQRLASAYRKTEQFAKAEELLQEGRKLIGTKLGAFSYAMRFCLDELGQVQLAQGKLEAAEKSFKESLDIASKPQRRTSFDASAEGTRVTIRERRDPFSALEPLNGLGLVALKKGNKEEAAKWFTRGIEEAEKVNRTKKQYWPVPAWNLAELHMEQKKFDLAEKTLLQASEQQAEDSPMEKYGTLQRLAVSYVKRGEDKKLSEIAMQIGRLKEEPAHPFAAGFGRLLAAESGGSKAARALFETLVKNLEESAGKDSALLAPYLDQWQVALKQEGAIAESDVVNGRLLGLKLKHGL